MNQIALIFGEFAGGNFHVMEKMEVLLDLITKSGDAFSLGAIHCFMGIVSLNAGDYLLAKLHNETTLGLYQPKQHEQLRLFNGSNLEVETRAHNILVLQLLGYPDQAREQLRILQKLAKRHRNLHDIFLLNIFFPNLHLLLREYAPIISFAEKGMASLDASKGHNYRLIDLLKKNALAGMGHQDAIFSAYELYRALYQEGYKFFSGFNFSNLCESLKVLDLPERGLKIVQEGIDIVESTGEGTCLPNLYRLKGNFLIMLQQSETEVEQLYLKALNISKQQSAKWHELLAAKSLARFWQSQGKIQEAYNLLNGVYNWFTEGFDTVDMIEAKELLEELGAMKTN